MKYSEYVWKKTRNFYVEKDSDRYNHQIEP